MINEIFETNPNPPKNVKVLDSPRIDYEIEKAQPLKNEEIDWGDDSLEIEEFEKFKRKKKVIVEKVLKKWEKTTNNDRILDFECLRVEFPEIKIYSDKQIITIKIPKKLMKFIPSAESYRRIRQELNSEGKYLPTNPEVRVRRGRQERVIKRYYGIRKNDKSL